MKNGIILIVLSCSLFTFLGACNSEAGKASSAKTPVELLRTTWEVDEWIVDPKLNMPDSMVEKMVKDATMEFKPDSTFIFKGMNPTPTTGRYDLSPDGLLLTLFPTGLKDGFGHSVTELTA